MEFVRSIYWYAIQNAAPKVCLALMLRAKCFDDLVPTLFDALMASFLHILPLIPSIPASILTKECESFPSIKVKKNLHYASEAPIPTVSYFIFALLLFLPSLFPQDEWNLFTIWAVTAPGSPRWMG